MKAPSIVPDRRSCLTDLTVDQPPLPPSSSQAPMPLENILDSLDDGIIVLDRQGVILKANPSFCRLFTTSAEGMRAAEVVPGDTFREMLDAFLLDTLPEETRQGYLTKLETSIRFWRTKGGCLSDETIEELRKAGANIEVLSDTNYKTTKKPVRMDYLDDIDITQFKEIPTYKRMCICIIKNDHLCKYMGFSLTKEEMNRRKAIQEKYKDL